MTSRQTPSQTVGPFFAPALVPAPSNRYQPLLGASARSGVADMAVDMIGCVRDGAGEVIADALIEAVPVVSGASEPDNSIARVDTASGEFRFTAAKTSGAEAPAIDVLLFMRGLLRHLYTRIYFADEAERNARDPFLSSVPERLRERLLAVREREGVYRFDIHMQGERETPFIER